MSTAKLKTSAPQAQPAAKGLDLAKFGDLSSLLNTPAKTGDGLPLQIPIDAIDPDPNQPRKADNPGFSRDSLDELAGTIRARGVKTPISVRENPEQPGRYIINHGERRYRASIIAEKLTIPAYVDADYSAADQVIENLHRNDLTAREIADWIGREMAAGKKKGEIAGALGKSAAFVTQHVTLLDLPEPIASAFNAGRVRDVTLVNELVKAHKENAPEVCAWLDDDSQDITRGSVKLLRDFLDTKSQTTSVEVEVDVPAPAQLKPQADAQEEPEPVGQQASTPDPDKLKKAIVLVRHDERRARLLLTRRPAAAATVWIKYEDDGQEIEVSAETVALAGIIEG